MLQLQTIVSYVRFTYRDTSMNIFEDFISKKPSFETDVNSDEGFIEVKVITQPDNVTNPLEVQDINNEENEKVIDEIYGDLSVIGDALGSMESIYDTLSSFGIQNKSDLVFLGIGFESALHPLLSQMNLGDVSSAMESIKEDLTGEEPRDRTSILRKIQATIINGYNTIVYAVKASINKIGAVYTNIFSNASKAHANASKYLSDLVSVDELKEREFNFNDSRFLYSNGKINTGDDLVAEANTTLEIADSLVTNRGLYTVIHAYGNVLKDWGSKTNKSLDELMTEYVTGPNSRLASALQKFNKLTSVDQTKQLKGDMLGAASIYYTVSAVPSEMGVLGFIRASPSEKTSGNKVKSLTKDEAARLAEVVKDISGKILEYRNNWQLRQSQTKDLVKQFDEIKNDLTKGINANTDMMKDEAKLTIKYYKLILSKLWNSIITTESYAINHLVDVCNALNKYIEKSIR